MPHDLLRASGKEVRGVSLDCEYDTAPAAGILESKFAPWCSAVIANWMAGAYDHFETIVFSRADDTVQRLYYYVCELQRRGTLAGPEAIMFDVSLIPRASSEARQYREVRALAKRLNVTDSRLREAIVSTNAARKASPPPAGKVCLLVGTPPSDDRLHAAIARAGCTPVGDTLQELWADLGPAVDESASDPALALARQIRERAGPRSFGDAGAAVAADIASLAPVCGVLWLSNDDESTGWQIPALREPFEAAGIPLLEMTCRDPHLADGAEDEIEKFVGENSE
ncbi:hypothetical protein V5F89_00965 [Pelagerythrobacter marensis]|uniref:Uncharacterized protein n=1 Tax=Pelagerythrobacter marensis TaxID=543877 RepID=A0ABZ2D815_9SPHN